MNNAWTVWFTLYSCEEDGSLSEYMITLKCKTKEQLVQLNSSDGAVECTWKKFETIYFRFSLLCAGTLCTWPQL
jgi:hypothetical protein